VTTNWSLAEILPDTVLRVTFVAAYALADDDDEKQNAISMSTNHLKSIKYLLYSERLVI